MGANQIAGLLTSNNGRLMAAGALFLAVWALKNHSPLRAVLSAEPSRVKILAALLAILPALGLALVSDAGWREILQTGLVALFGAMGIHSAGKS